MDQRRAENVGGTGDTSNMRSMTAPTPAQMRALASRADRLTPFGQEVRAALRAAAAGIEFQAEQIEFAIAQYRAAAAQLEAVLAELEDVRGAYRMSSAALDRFRDVACEATGFVEANPGDDVVLKTLREQVGLYGPEATRWREFVTAARAQVDQINAERRRTTGSASQDADVSTDGIYGVTHFPIKEWTERSDD